MRVLRTFLCQVRFLRSEIMTRTLVATTVKSVKPATRIDAVTAASNRTVTGPGPGAPTNIPGVTPQELLCGTPTTTCGI